MEITDTQRLDYLIAEAFYEGSGPDRKPVLSEFPNGVALVIDGDIDWPEGVRTAIDAAMKKDNKNRGEQ